eukprot:763370-Hanusia_phi.AAC.6
MFHICTGVLSFSVQRSCGLQSCPRCFLVPRVLLVVTLSSSFHSDPAFPELITPSNLDGACFRVNLTAVSEPLSPPPPLPPNFPHYLPRTAEGRSGPRHFTSLHVCEAPGALARKTMSMDHAELQEDSSLPSTT